jgi:hypothetical protein
MRICVLRFPFVNSVEQVAALIPDRAFSFAWLYPSPPPSLDLLDRFGNLLAQLSSGSRTPLAAELEVRPHTMHSVQHQRTTSHCSPQS